ncbi:hypothetical protein RJ641_029987, partial [Dillenia turbinata]
MPISLHPMVKEMRRSTMAQCRRDVDKKDFTADPYDTEDFIGHVDTAFGIFYINVENATDPKTFDKKLGSLLDDVESEACIRDLPPLSCAQCTAIAVGNFPTFCPDRKGCRALYISCYV